MHLVGFIIRIYHAARSPEHQILNKLDITIILSQFLVQLERQEVQHCLLLIHLSVNLFKLPHMFP